MVFDLWPPSFLCFSQDEEGRAATQAMVSELEGRLAALQADITALQGAQTKLMAELRTCCKNDSALALLVRNGVREQLAGVRVIVTT